jgi:alkyldihydroxyacetonephosphate synthase
MRTCLQEGVNLPTMRLSNEDETALSFKLRPPAHGWKKTAQGLFMKYLNSVKGFTENVSLGVMGFEGTPNQITEQKAKAMAIVKRWGGVDLGTSVGLKWYAAKYDYPYLRDMVMNFGVIVDVTETSVNWGKLAGLDQQVNDKIRPHVGYKNYTGYLGCHLSHSYHSGACMYYTFATTADGDQLKKYRETKKAIVDVILEAGGSLSHHHAIGYEHLPWYEGYVGKTGLSIIKGLKEKIDPKNIMNPGKLLVHSDQYREDYWPEFEKSLKKNAS